MLVSEKQVLGVVRRDGDLRLATLPEGKRHRNSILNLQATSRRLFDKKHLPQDCRINQHPRDPRTTTVCMREARNQNEDDSDESQSTTKCE